jgi:hypothetical protein
MSFFHKLVCRIIGHTSQKNPLLLFRTWDGLFEIGSLHCQRCGKMLGEYKHNMTRPAQ